ncbi:hypothetical protein JXD38_08840, partial [candidate division WOR-3 bacterium]|nr:hypothetical protein [candidate division WOR-3 bacterium]
MNPEDKELVEAARSVVGHLRLHDDFSAGDVGAAVRTATGSIIYTSICTDLACSPGFCAEVAAVAGMLKHRETHIAAVVAVGDDGAPVAPCGRCRETIAQVYARNLDCRVILGDKRVIEPQDLLPEFWLPWRLRR